MHHATSAIVLQRRVYGDYDLILTVFTYNFGKCTLIAKAAKKSTKRFPGILEPFASLRIMYRTGRSKSLPVLEEASLIRPHGAIRGNMLKTAYASYWSELITLWLEEGQRRLDIYQLFEYVLAKLAADKPPAAMLSVLFQMRFLSYEGLQPVLEHCTACHSDLSEKDQRECCIDLSLGGVVCQNCPPRGQRQLRIAKGTLKQLQWIASGDLNKALRVRFAGQALHEATVFLEAFVPFHIGRQPKSLSFLQQMRSQVG